MTRARGCLEFRVRLAQSLEGRPLPAELTVLSWHEHLLGCGACRALLEREEALEALLASLPDPHLPPDLARRVLTRLRGDRGAADGLDGLDDLLELDLAGEAPAGLAGRVLAGVRAEEHLDRLLERDRVAIPAGLAQRVLAALEAERAAPASADPLDRLLELDRELTIPPELSSRVRASLAAARRPARPFALRLLRSPLVHAAAAGVAFALTAWWAGGPGQDGADAVRRGPGVASIDRGGPDAELLAFLEDGGFDIVGDPLVWRLDEDPELALAASLDSRDEAVLDAEWIGEER